jgi:hypothetical protein
VSLVERGHLDRVSLASLRRLAAALDMRVDVVARWRGGEVDRLLNARHSALHEAVARRILATPGWQLLPEVSFAIGAERGVIDILAFHRPSGSLLVIELKTAIVDVNDLVSTMDRKRRLAGTVARERGWEPASVSSWLIVADGRTNRRRMAAHRTMLRAAFPGPARVMLGWLQQPRGTVHGLCQWPSSTPGGAAGGSVQRVRSRGTLETR